MSLQRRSATGRAMHFNMCEWGVENPWEWGFDVAHSWRISGDHSASWASTKRAISKVVTLPHEYGGHRLARALLHFRLPEGHCDRGK